MKPHSLRLRLLLLSALAVLISLTVAGVVLTSLFAQHVEREATRRLTDDLNRLAALIDADAPALSLTQSMSDPRFDVPFGGIYWQVRDPSSGDLLRSRSTWDQTLSPPQSTLVADRATTFRLIDPEGSPAVGVGRDLAFELANGGTRTLEIVVAEDSEAAEAAVANYRADLFRSLIVLALILMLSTWAQVTLGLSPLKAIRRGINAIRTGRAQSLQGDFPTEIEPLVVEVNELTRAQELSIQFARERAADLAHGLKGQLQVLNTTAHDLRLKGDGPSANAIESLTAEMASTIDHQLGLSRLRRRSPNRTVSSDLEEYVGRTIRTLQKTSRGRELDWNVDIAAGTRIALDGSDLAELLGALLENAAKWANGRVAVRGGREGQRTVCSVEDDGPGLSQEQIDKLGQRGQRLDEERSGSGIGISIVREIVALNEGTLAFERSPLGGLAARVSLPVHAPQP